MKFTIIKSKFLEGLKNVQNIVGAKGSLPILQNVLIEAKGKELILTTTDLDISIRCQLECEIQEEGSSTLPVKFLFAAMTKADEGKVEVRIDSNDKGVVISGKSRLTLNGMKAEDFPKLNSDEESLEYKLPRSIFYEMLKKTHYAASQDDTRRTLKGVLMSFKSNNLTMVATDGRRLAMINQEIEFPAESDKDITLPAKTVQELLRSINGEGDVRLVVQKSKICFELENLKIYSKLIDDVYPNYNQVIPKNNETKISVDRLLLINALERANVMSIDESHSAKLIFSENNLTVTTVANNIGDFHDEVAIKYNGSPLEIVFNPDYVMDPLKAIDDDEIIFNLNSGSTPAIITCSIPFLYVIMPLRVN